MAFNEKIVCDLDLIFCKERVSSTLLRVMLLFELNNGITFTTINTNELLEEIINENQ